MAASRSSRFAAIVLAWVAATLVGAAIGTAWLPESSAWSSARACVYVPAALISNTAMLACIPGAGLALLAILLRSRRALGIVQAAVWTVFLVLLYADTRIWRLFRYHFNPMVWNVITTPGSEDAVDLGPKTWTFVLVVAVALFAAFLFAWSAWFLPEDDRSALARRRVARIASLVLLGAVLLDKGLYAVADIDRDRTVTAVARSFPMYQRFTVQRLAKRVFGLQLEAREKVEVGGESLLLHYPIEKPRIDPAGPRPNVLVLVIDSLRADMLAEETMPRTWAFATRARRFDNHLSGGNATRFGIFSLVYGIHGTYWMPVLQDHAPPVLVTALQELGYDLRVLSTASMNFPEFRSTAWVTIEDRVEDHFDFAGKIERDAHIPVRFGEWLGEREAAGRKDPFYCFALIDAPHGTYDWPKDETVFRPYVERVDFLEMAGEPTAEAIAAVKNSYKNAVHFADSVVGRMLDELERRGLAESTIVVVTGDHGEEFFEHGHFGHTSNFAPEQTHVTFVMGGPGIPPGVETRPTCHVDLAPTLLARMGADPAQRALWSQGEDLLAPLSERDRIIGGWDEVAMWVPGGILRVPLEGHRGFLEAYDYQWQRLPDESALLARSGAAIARLAQECRKFLR
jgi:membrane-anchored protein YejM (alkaline phosphatase superfamily)